MLPLLSLVLFGLVGQSIAHYLVGYTIINGTKSSAFQYVRDVYPPGEYIDSIEFGRTYPLWTPDDIYKNNFTCGRGAWDYAPKTETATVIAGSDMGFGVVPLKSLGEKYWNFFHEGPAFIYMAKAKDELEKWVGNDGDWFKVAQWAYKDEEEKKWAIQGNTTLTFTIPPSTPPGKYLVRVQTFNWIPSLQWYVYCAHVEVVGPGGGTPTSFAKFPGAYNIQEVQKILEQYQPWKFTNFTGDPALWEG